MSVFAIPENPLPGGLETSGLLLIFEYLKTFSCFVVSIIILHLKNLVFGSLRTSLLCIMGELAGGGFVAVAAGVNDR